MSCYLLFLPRIATRAVKTIIKIKYSAFTILYFTSFDYYPATIRYIYSSVTLIA